MNGEIWIFSWIGYLIATIGGAATLGFLRKKPSRGYLIASVLVGALGLIYMAVSLHATKSATIALPRPWPTLIANPLPLASLWSVVAGVLFFSATLVIARHPLAHRLLYAVVPLVGGVGIFLWSGDGLLLLMSWEFISASTYLGLVTVRRARPVWNAGWALLALSELGGMLLLIALVWLIPAHGAVLTDSFANLSLQASRVPHFVTDTIMVLVVIAFGVKAGLFPVMIWMPMAEPEAPGVVAGIFSGLLTALAVSGILALTEVAGHEITWGIILLVLGVSGALAGALYSILERQVKRILAYSTIEILGFVFASLGIWRIDSLIDPKNIASSLAMDAAIVLLIMHAGAKFVLFSVTDYTGQFSRTLDALGGLIRRSRRIAFVSLIGVLTLGAFPPLGGFVGEWLILESILKPIDTPQTAYVHILLMAAGALIALASALGVAAYLRWFGFIFLGINRGSDKGQSLSAPDHAMTLGLVLPLVLVIVAGPGVPWLIPFVNRQLSPFLSSRSPVVAPSFIHPNTASPLVPIGINLIPAPGAHGTVFFPQSFNVGDPYVLLLMGAFLTLIVALIRLRMRRHYGVRLVPPWNGGAEPYRARTSWSAEGFSHPLRLAFARFYGLIRNRHDQAGIRFYRHTIIYRLEEHLYRPLLGTATMVAKAIRRIQSGRTTQYVAYVWISVLIAIGIVAIR